MAEAGSDIKHGFLSKIHAVAFSSCLALLNSSKQVYSITKNFSERHGSDKKRSLEPIHLIYLWQSTFFSNKGFVFETPADFLLSYILVHSHANYPIICIYLTVS